MSTSDGTCLPLTSYELLIAEEALCSIYGEGELSFSPVASPLLQQYVFRIRPDLVVILGGLVLRSLVEAIKNLPNLESEKSIGD